MRIRDAVLQVAGRLCKYALLATPTAKGFDAIEAPEQAPDEPKASIPARRLMWFGFRSVPPAGSECAVIASRAGASNNMIVGCENLGYGPVDLETGEAAVFSQFDQLIFLDKEGSITSTAAGSSIQQFKDGNIVLISKGGATLAMSESAAVSEHDELFRSTHFGGRGGMPIVATPAGGGALGTNGLVITLLTEGTDTAFRFTCQVDPMTSGGPGDIAEVTFAKKFTRAPRGVSIQAANDAAALVVAAGASVGGGSYYFSITDEKLIVKTTATLVPAATLVFSVMVIE